MKKILLSLVFCLIASSSFACGFNGSGVYVRCYNWVNDKNNGINITASRFDNEDDNFATGLSTTITKDGQQTTTARIPFAVGLSVNPGSAATPGFSIISDTGTGIYQSSSGFLDFTSEGTRVGGFSTNGLDNTPVGLGTAAAGSFTTLISLGTSTLNSLSVTNDASITGNNSITGNMSVGGTFIATGTSTLSVLSGSGTRSVTVGSTGILSTLSSSSITKINTQLITSTGTYTPSAGLVYARVRMCASGSAGGTTSTSTTGGGGAGGCAEFLETAAQIGVSKTVTIGAAGSNTTFGSLVSCTPGGSVSSSTGVGGTGGTCTVTTGTTVLNWPGAAGASVITNVALAGTGASSMLGTGGMGGLNTVAGGAGNPATGYGSGGGGSSAGGTVAGGTPGPAVAIIDEYISQ